MSTRIIDKFKLEELALQPVSFSGKRAYLKLSPELYDGHQSEITDEAGAMERIRQWFYEFRDVPGASFSLEVIALTEQEFSALPEL